VVRITAFAKIEEALLLVVKAAQKAEAAQFTPGERLAREQIIKAAIHLQKTFENLAKKTNEQFSTENRQWLKTNNNSKRPSIPRRKQITQKNGDQQ